MRYRLLQTIHGRRRSGSLDNFNRVVILTGTISATLIALLLEQLLSLSVGEAEKQLDTICRNDVVVFRKNFLGNFTSLEPVGRDGMLVEKDYRPEWDEAPTEQSRLPC